MASNIKWLMEGKENTNSLLLQKLDPVHLS